MPSPRSLRLITLLNCATATAFGAASWLRQRSTNATNTVPSQEFDPLYKQKAKDIFTPNLNKVFREYLGCQRFRTGVLEISLNGDVAKVAEIRVVLFLDADAAIETLKGSVLRLHYTPMDSEETDLVASTQKILKE